MIKNFIFDLDGTLIDTIENILYALNETLTIYGVKTKTTEECKAMLGWGFRVLLEKSLYPEIINPNEIVKIHQTLSKIYKENPTNGSKVYEGINEVLDFLEEKNIPFCIATNKEQASAEIVVKHFFPKRKFALIKGVTGSITKPNLEFVKACLKVMNAKEEETCFIGDSEIDYQTGINGGVLSISAAWGFRTYEELKAINKIVIKKPLDILKYYKDDKFIF